MKGRNAVLGHIKHSYFKAPTSLYTRFLSVEGVALYTYLASCGEAFNPSQRHVAKVLGMSRNRLIKAYNELEYRNMIVCIHKGYKNKVKLYEFIKVSDWR